MDELHFVRFSASVGTVHPSPWHGSPTLEYVDYAQPASHENLNKLPAYLRPVSPRYQVPSQRLPEFKERDIIPMTTEEFELFALRTGVLNSVLEFESYEPQPVKPSSGAHSQQGHLVRRALS